MRNLALVFSIFTALVGFPMTVGAQNNSLAVVEKGENHTATLDIEAKLVTTAAEAGAPPQAKGSMANKLILAMTEARKKAYTRLAIFLENLPVDGETTIGNSGIIDNVFRIQFDALVKSAREIDGQRFYEKDGSVRYRSMVALYFTGNNSLSSILIPKLQEQRGTPPQEAREMATAKHTGLVIDARGLSLQLAIAPRLVDQGGREVYGVTKAAAGAAIQFGLAGYATSIGSEAVIARVGSNPLMIKAQRVLGRYQADLVVADDDADKILQADAAGHFLSACRVVIWINNNK